MGLAGPSLGRELRALSSSEPHRTGAGVAPAEISVTKSRTDCDLTQQMVGGIKASSPGMMSMSADMFLDLPTMSAPSGEERTPRTSAQVERAGRCCRRSDSSMHTWCGRATVMVLVSSSSGPRVSGCTRARRYFGPHPVEYRTENHRNAHPAVSTGSAATVCADRREAREMSTEQLEVVLYLYFRRKWFIRE